MNRDKSKVTHKGKGTPTRLIVLFTSTICSFFLLTGCSDGSDSKPRDPLPVYDFTAVDVRLQKFIDDIDVTEGISVTIVDSEQGTVHEAAFGDHEPNIVTLVASVSKFLSATLLMAIHEDDSVGFDIDQPIGNYLPWEGVYGGSTTTQLLSNTSGIPGVLHEILFGYGVHNCQYDPGSDFEECAKLVYSTELPDSNTPGTEFDYGGSQWYLVSAVATQVTNSDWNQAFDEYVAGPCDLEVFTYGNVTSQDEDVFTGHPDSLAGQSNPHPGGGAMTSMQDMAKLLRLHLREGMCGNNKVLSPDAVKFMQVNRIEGLINQIFPGRSYGMGWWGREQLPNVIYDSGLWGSIAWIDTQRMIGGFIAIDDYSQASASGSWALAYDEIIPLVGELVDEARKAVDE